MAQDEICWRPIISRQYIRHRSKMEFIEFGRFAGEYKQLFEERLTDYI